VTKFELEILQERFEFPKKGYMLVSQILRKTISDDDAMDYSTKGLLEYCK